MEVASNISTLNELTEIFDQAIKNNANYIGVCVKTEGYDEPEIIINPKKNFKDKLNYYKNAYNNDLVLNTYSGVSIIGCEFGDSVDEVADWLIE